MKKSVLLLLINSIVLCSFGQGVDKKLTLKNISDISLYITDNYKLEPEDLDTACINSVVFIRFKILPSNKISELAFSGGAPQFIIKALSKALLAAQVHIALTAGDKKVVGKKTFVLPVIYYYSGGCSVVAAPKDTTKKISGEKELLDVIARQEKTQNSVSHLLDFGDKSVDMLDCILLRPVEVAGPVF